MSDLERRHVPYTELEIRQGDGKEYIEGHSALFGVETDIGGLFIERIERGAFAESIRADDVRSFFNHNHDYILGRQSAGTLLLAEDERGLHMRNDPPDTAWGRDTKESIRRGDITGQSFSFVVQDEVWERRPDGKDVRTLKKVKLVDVGPVTFPAYETTDITVATRAYNTRQQAEAEAEQAAEREAEEQAEAQAKINQERLNHARKLRAESKS